MNNKERLAKLKQAHELIREVEFSYERGDPVRHEIYSAVVHSFGVLGIFSSVILRLEERILAEKRAAQDKDTD